MTRLKMCTTQDDLDPDGLASDPRTRSLRRRIARVAFTALVIYVGWCGVLYVAQDRLIFPRHFAPDPVPRHDRPGRLIKWLEIEDGQRVEAWFYPVLDADGPTPAVIFFHGNADLIDTHEGIARGYHALGCAVLLPEFRGYGLSGGDPSQKAIVADAVRFHDWLCERPEVDPDRIVIHGRSLGGGIAAALAEKRPPRALILGSTFTSMASFARKYGAPPFLVRHPLRTDRVVRHLDMPILLFHGTRDTIVPVHHGRRLRDLAKRPIYVEFDCGHNDLPPVKDIPTYWQTIRDYLTTQGVLPEDGPPAPPGSS